MMNELIELIYSIDHSIMRFIQENMRFDFLTPIMKGISLTVNLGIMWILIGAVMLIFKKTRMIGAVVLSSLALGLLVNNVIIKNIVDRARPYENYSDLIPLIPYPHGSSFASGHTTASFAAAGIFVRFFNKPIAAAALTYAILVGISRVYLGVHYPTDVIAGCMIGALGSVFVYWIYEKKFDLSRYKLKKTNDKPV